MDVEVLHIDDCPNWTEAGQRLTAALTATGHAEEQIRYVLIDSATLAERHHFAGSPTLLVDGVDLFPDGAPTVDLACRVYRTRDGLARLPTTEQIIEALAAR